MIHRRTAARASLLSAASVLAAVVAVGCVAAPGASIGPSASIAPSAAPSAQPSSPTSPPSGAPSAPPSSAPSTKPSTATCGVATWATGPNDLVLRLRLAGGFVPPGVDQTNIPVVSVMGDGRVITQGPQIMIYPGPLLPSLQVQVLNAAGMRKLLDAAAEAGLLVPDITYEQHSVADAPTSFFTLIADGCTHHVNADALMELEITTGLDQKTIEARAKLLKFRNALSDLPTLVGAANVSDGGTFQAGSFRIVSREESAGTGATGSPVTTVKWPLATPLATFGAQLSVGLPDTRCGVAGGADAQTLKPLLEKANAETHWSSGGRTYYLRVRPLLPDESGCSDPIV
jgi:hypothetical protein